jgi:hypothetical protein
MDSKFEAGINIAIKIPKGNTKKQLLFTGTS